MISRKSFQVGQKVLLYQSCVNLFPGKLRSRWIGTYVILKTFPHGAYEIQSEDTLKIFKVNGQRLKPYFENFQKEHEIVEKLNYAVY